MKILIADDSHIMQKWLKSTVQVYSSVEKIYQVYSVSDAKFILYQEKIDVVISDIKMPYGTGSQTGNEQLKYGGNGFDLLDHIKNKYKDIVTIMITNYPYSQYKERSKKLGADYFLNKNSDLQEIVCILKNIGKNN